MRCLSHIASDLSIYSITQLRPLSPKASKFIYFCTVGHKIISLSRCSEFVFLGVYELEFMSTLPYINMLFNYTPRL